MISYALRNTKLNILVARKYINYVKFELWSSNCFYERCYSHTFFVSTKRSTVLALWNYRHKLEQTIIIKVSFIFTLISFSIKLFDLGIAVLYIGALIYTKKLRINTLQQTKPVCFYCANTNALNWWWLKQLTRARSRKSSP